MTEPLDLGELDRLLAAAPMRLSLLGAPWATNTGPPVILLGSDDPHAAEVVLCGQDIDEWPADERGPDYTRQERYAELAVAAVNALPSLLARVQAAEATVAAVQQTSIGLADVSVEQSKQLAAFMAAARAVMARGGHADGCLIRDYGGCTCGWENALAELAALLEGDA